MAEPHSACQMSAVHPRQGELVRVAERYTVIMDVLGGGAGAWQVRTLLTPWGQTHVVARVLIDTGRSRVWLAHAGARDVRTPHGPSLDTASLDTASLDAAHTVGPRAHAHI